MMERQPGNDNIVIAADFNEPQEIVDSAEIERLRAEVERLRAEVEER
jgi:hypothetical protein